MLLLDMLLQRNAVEYEKKKNTLLSYFFASNPNLKNFSKNSDFQNLTFFMENGLLEAYFPTEIVFF